MIIALCKLVVICILIAAINVNITRAVEQDTFQINNPADAYDLVFSTIDLDENCRLAFQNCVLNENNNNQLNMELKCDVISKSIACMDRANFLNSECDFKSIETKIDKYRSFLVDFLNKCELDKSASSQLNFKSINLNSSSPKNEWIFFLNLFLILISTQFMLYCYL